MTRSVLPQFIVAVLSGLIGALVWSAPGRAQTAPENQVMFEVLNRLEQLEQEVRKLRGDMDLYKYRQDEAEQRLKAQYLDISRRLQALEGAGLSPGPAGAGLGEPGFGTEEPAPPAEGELSTVPPPVTMAPSIAPGEPDFPQQPPGAAYSSPSSPGSEQEAYDAAFGLLRDGHYEQAVPRFQDFLRAYPDSSLAGNAQYWLGEAYYVTRDFNKSRDAFLTLGARYPTSNKLPDALFKLSYIYEQLGDKAKAREVLQKLTQAYPNTQAAGQAQKRLNGLR